MAVPNDPIDRAGEYRDACNEFADALGYDAGSIRHWWRECSLMRRYEQRWPAPLAEWMALRDVCAMFDKRGRLPD